MVLALLPFSQPEVFVMSKIAVLAGKPSDAAQKLAEAEEAGSVLETGDVFVADTGEYVGKWEGRVVSLPMEIAMVVDAYEYIYKLDRREKRQG